MAAASQGGKRAVAPSCSHKPEKNELESQIPNSLTDLGFAVLGQARYEEARVLFEESLRRCSELGWKENVAFIVVGLAEVSAEANDREQAARLLGQAERLANEIHLKLEPYADTVRDRTHRELESRLDPARFASCFEEGRATPFEDVISLALSDVD